jgi:transcriptional regulator with GAF, ATPase, and Fis domain
MSSDSDVFSRTARRQTGAREVARLPVVLVVGSGESLASLKAPRFVPFNDRLEIGRRPAEGDPQRSLVLPDRTVSSTHARISRVLQAGEAFTIEDLGSTNGTHVDGQQIVGPTPLRNGSLIFIASQVLVFRLVTPAELAALKEEEARPLAQLPTLSPSMAVIASKLRLLSRSNVEILLVGETGVGKEVFANAIHAQSGRNGSLVAINCAAIPRELVESELFGYEKGAHSTAQGRKPGLVELADRGTLFLDEIGDMPSELQSKLLRFLQDRRFTPLGSTRVIEANVRVIAATSRVTLDKGAHVQEALLGRLGAQPIVLPPLRERPEDIGRLTAHFLGQISEGRALEPEAFHALMLHTWPLNVRELSKVVTEAEALSRNMTAIGLEHLPDAVTATLALDPNDPLDDTSVDPPDARVGSYTDSGGFRDGDAPVPTRIRRPAPTREELTSLLGEFKGSVAQVARHLDRQYAVVWRCIQRYGIDAATYRNRERG